ncbi:MAG: cyclodeaminase/cyclohydrolase family protein [Deltaproteobacteria bacterium]|nr:cyclodeaminase/cyclohydrolase family protein [Deltaproteobacteria bacterium]
MNPNINAFMRVLDANDNSTGGGTASCVAGAMAAGLAGMVARLSMGKKDLAPREHYEAIAAEAEKLSKALLTRSVRPTGCPKIRKKPRLHAAGQSRQPCYMQRKCRLPMRGAANGFWSFAAAWRRATTPTRPPTLNVRVIWLQPASMDARPTSKSTFPTSRIGVSVTKSNASWRIF